MKTEIQIKERLEEYAQSIECPDKSYYKVKNSYNKYKANKEKVNHTKKFISCKRGIAACASLALLLICTSAYAAPKITEIIRSYSLQEEGVNMEWNELKPEKQNLEGIQAQALNKVYAAFPETKEFDIASIKTGLGNVETEQMNWCEILLKENGNGTREFYITIDNTTGNILSYGKTNWDIKYSIKDNISLLNTAKLDLEALFGDLDSFEGKMVEEEVGLKEKLEYVDDTREFESRNRAIITFDNPKSSYYYKVYFENNSFQVSVLLK